MQKWLMIVGTLLILIGLFFPWLSKLPLGRLPGDLLIKKEHYTVYFPIVTCLIISLILSLLFWIFNK